MKIGVELNHDIALATYVAAGHTYPAIPPGKNTIWHHFATAEGQCALIINQRGFSPSASDNEEAINGCSLAVAFDAPDDATAQATLEKWVREFLEIAP